MEPNEAVQQGTPLLYWQPVVFEPRGNNKTVTRFTHAGISTALCLIQHSRECVTNLGGLLVIRSTASWLEMGIKKSDWFGVRNDWRKEQFNHILFTDESSVMLETHRKKCYRKIGAPRKLKPHPKHPMKVHVWGGISKQGATSIVIFMGIMTTTR